MKGFLTGILDFVKNNKDLASLFTKPAMRAGESELHYEVRVKEKNQRNRFFFLFLPLTIFYLEVVFHIFVFGEYSVTAFVLTALFSFALGLLANGILLLTPLGVNRLLTPLCVLGITLIIASQYVYYAIFGGLYSLELVDMAGEAATDFISVLIDKMGKSWLGIIMLFLPLALFLKNRKKYAPTFAPSFKFRLILICIALLLQFLAIGIVGLDRGNIFNGTGNCYYYSYDFEPLESAKRFGVMTNMRLDLKQFIFGTKEVPFVIEDDPVVETTTATSGEDVVEEPIVYGDNVMNIDFDALIEGEKDKTVREMHEYFKSLTPTKQNEYTGLFKDKNLIFITLEGFSYKTIDQNRTPTLYKMANEGFVFTNSYTSLWGGSTATGEYAAMTGNFHQSAKCLGMCGGKNLYFALGNQFSRIGYDTYAFHNHTYDYYSRDKSHPNMGYEYIAIGNGLEKAPINELGDTIKGGWPRSDHEMALATLPYYINSDKPFHVYYMTVSGHANYNFGGNKMSAKHKAIVESMNASDGVKAYHACQYEVELMLDELVRALEAAGKLDDTVFVMSADHYPYSLTPDELKELYGITAADVYDDLDLLRNSIIIWCSDMEEPVVVDKPCSSIDIIPTVSNLFGLEYDSRLITGTDILSESDPLVILNALFTGPNWCWMNKNGLYNGSTGVFTPAEGFDLTGDELNDYVKKMNNVLLGKRKYSPKILEKDYYDHVFE